MPAWKTFTAKAQTRSDPTITIQSNGILALNAGAYEALGRAANIEYLYDDEERIMGLRAVSGEESHAYKLRPQKSGGGATASGKAFLSYWQIPLEESRRFAATMMDGVLAIDLKKELPARVSRTKPD